MESPSTTSAPRSGKPGVLVLPPAPLDEVVAAAPVLLVPPEPCAVSPLVSAGSSPHAPRASTNDRGMRIVLRMNRSMPSRTNVQQRMCHAFAPPTARNLAGPCFLEAPPCHLEESAG